MEHFLAILSLFFFAAKIFENLKEKESAKRLFTRTLHIYLYLAKVEVEFPFERHMRIKELREILLQ